MRRLIILLTFWLPVTVYAQQNQFEAGIEGGPGIAAFTLAPGVVAAGSAGAVFQYNFHKFFSIRTGIEYERKGTTGKYMPNGCPFGNQLLNENFKLDYLTLPLLVRASFGRRVAFFVNGGFFVSYLANANLIESAPGVWIKDNEDSKSYRINFGSLVGMGIAIPIAARFTLSFEARNTVGFSSVNDGVFGGCALISHLAYTDVFLAGFTYKFGFKHSLE